MRGFWFWFWVGEKERRRDEEIRRLRLIGVALAHI